MQNKNDNMIQLDDLKLIHQKVLDFTFNCDNKASFLGAVLGVLITALVSANPFWMVVDKLKQSGKLYWEGGKSIAFDWLSFFCGAFLVIGVFAIAVALFSIFCVLTARLKSNNDSLIYFGTIARETEDQYIQTIENSEVVNLNEDYMHQIHICSQICAKKFKAYNVAVICSIVSLIAFCLFVGFALFI